jgi:hypothetical protein
MKGNRFPSLPPFLGELWHHCSPKRRHPPANLHGVTAQNTRVLIYNIFCEIYYTVLFPGGFSRLIYKLLFYLLNAIETSKLLALYYLFYE